MLHHRGQMILPQCVGGRGLEFKCRRARPLFALFALPTTHLAANIAARRPPPPETEAGPRIDWTTIRHGRVLVGWGRAGPGAQFHFSPLFLTAPAPAAAPN